MERNTHIAYEPVSVDEQVLDAVSNGLYYAPHDVLGAHLNDERTVCTIRVLRPFAKDVIIHSANKQYHAYHEWNGIFTAVIPSTNHGNEFAPPHYTVQTMYDNGDEYTTYDPYSILPTISDFDIHLCATGRHEQLWNVLGAHYRQIHVARNTTISGTAFAVWAPNAHAVRVIGDFNGWDGRQHAMRSLGNSGIWELFIPDVIPGTRYKYQILNASWDWVDKADPMEQHHQVPPATASIIYQSQHTWNDHAWMKHRKATNAHTQPMSIYEVHAGSWKHGQSYRQLADELIPYVKKLGFTHIEFMPLAQHPFPGSWGYQVTGYYAADSRLGNPDDFKYLIDRCHQANIGVIMDWVPAHFPKDDFALGRFDGTPLYEDPNPLRGEHPDWGTYIFNFGRQEVRNFLVANACYWLHEFHIDGLRVDAVASMLYLDYSRNDGQWQPNCFGGRENLEAINFLQEMTATAYKNNPGVVIIAEESTSWNGVTRPTDCQGLGFGFKWNMGWMHDTLAYLEEEPVYRQWHHNEITFSMVYAYSEHYVLPISHDEVVHGKGSLLQKMPGDPWKKFASVRALFAYQWSHPGRKLTFMGNEIAQAHEWNYNASIDWNSLSLDAIDHEYRLGMQQLVGDLNAMYRNTPALWEQDNSPEGFQWIIDDDFEHNVLGYIRKSRDNKPIIVIVNFSGNAWQNYQIPFAKLQQWKEILNTDATQYGGSGITNSTVTPVPEPYRNQPYSATVTLPALGAIFLQPVNR